MEDAALCETGGTTSATLGAAAEIDLEIDPSEQAMQVAPALSYAASSTVHSPPSRSLTRLTPAQEAEPRRSQRAAKPSSEQAPPSHAVHDTSAASASTSTSGEKRKRDQGTTSAQSKSASWAQSPAW